MCNVKTEMMTKLDEIRIMRDHVARKLVDVIEAQKSHHTGSPDWTRLELLFASLINEDDRLRLEMSQLVESMVERPVGRDSLIARSGTSRKM